MAINLNPFSSKGDPEQEQNVRRRFKSLWGRSSEEGADEEDYPYGEENDDENNYNDIPDDEGEEEDGEENDDESEGPDEGTGDLSEFGEEAAELGEGAEAGAMAGVEAAEGTEAAAAATEVAAAPEEGALAIGVIFVILAIFILVLVLGGLAGIGNTGVPAAACDAGPVVDGHVFPVDRSRVTEYIDSFGFDRPTHLHSGTDIMHKQDEKVKLFAITDGVVYRIHDAGNGYSLWLRSTNPNDKNYYFYTHMHDVLVKEDQKVTAGQLIAHSGGYNAGANGDHLHLSVGTKDNFTINLPFGSGAKPGQAHAPAPYESTLNPYPLLKAWDPKGGGGTSAGQQGGSSQCQTQTYSGGIVLQPSHQTDTGGSATEAERTSKIADYALKALKTESKSKFTSYPSQKDLKWFDGGSNACTASTAAGTGYAWEITESNKRSPIYFIGLHINEDPKNRVQGYYHKGETENGALADELAAAISKGVGLAKNNLGTDDLDRDCSSMGGRYKDSNGAPSFYSIDPAKNKAKYRVILEIGDNDHNSFWTDANMKKVGEAIASVLNQKVK